METRNIQGRTYNMLERAVYLAVEEDHSVAVVIHDSRFVNHCISILVNLGVDPPMWEKVHRSGVLCFQHVGEGSITFLSDAAQRGDEGVRRWEAGRQRTVILYDHHVWDVRSSRRR